MEYTKNYHLPQWKEDDRIMMRDFNDAMKNIDDQLATTYGTRNTPWELGSVAINESLAKTSIKTFEFVPSMVLIWANDHHLCITTPTSSASLRNQSGGTTSSSLCHFSISGTDLKMTYFYNGPSKISYLALK